jgi:hypothetical protein
MGTTAQGQVGSRSAEIAQSSHAFRETADQPSNVCAVSNLSRSQRESRAFQLTVASGGGGLATVIAAILWIVGAAGFGIVFLLAIFTAVCAYALRRTVGK